VIDTGSLPYARSVDKAVNAGIAANGGALVAGQPRYRGLTYMSPDTPGRDDNGRPASLVSQHFNV
jgi:hypothetical protein